MRRTLLVLLAVVLFICGSSGCRWTRPNVLHRYRSSGCYECLLGGRQPVEAGPPVAAYGYPYYTTRAPRDFLMSNPPSIGR